MYNSIRKILQRSIVVLVKTMDLSDGLYKRLVENGALTDDWVEYIRLNSFGSKNSEVRELLARIIKGGDSAYMGFLEALHATDQNDVVDLLMNADQRFVHAVVNSSI